MKILIIDTNVIYRKMISEILSGDYDLEIVGTASTLSIAFKKMDLLKPQVIILDSELLSPENSILLNDIYMKYRDLTTILIETPTDEVDEKKAIIRLIPVLHDVIKREEGETFREALYSSVQRLKFKYISSPGLIKRQTDTVIYKPDNKWIRKPSSNRKKEVVVIGISTGGPNALSVMMPMIPEDINVPILIVQHMPPKFTKTLGDSLNAKCKIRVKEAEDDDMLEPGLALIAPGGKHMIVEKKSFDTVVKIIDGEPVNNCKPSADVLFYSVDRIYGDRAIAVIMTGMGSDGTKALRDMRKSGAYIIAQDEKTCVVFGMPRAPVEEGLVDIVSPLEDIADEITKALQKR
ncbi:MAG: chemotaxis-specific protein-glutamate methyltransferase CheB [Candidatus Eremiobacterota bacterium]